VDGGNVSPQTDAVDNCKSSKKKSIARIDGNMTLAMAIERVTTQPGEWYFVPGSLQL
jgi:hypothetical protein